MADPPPPRGPTSVAPPPIYYLLVDGTNAVDSAAFGAALEKAFPAFKNLAEESLGRQEDPTADATGPYVKRLVDANHKELPIWRFHDKSGKDIAVVMPGGKDGRCADKAWAIPANRSKLAEGDALLMQTLLRTPRTNVSPGTSPPRLGFEPPAPSAGSAPGRTAELLQVSSHGWLGGFMRGEAPAAMATGNPPDDDWSVHPPYFAVGSAASRGDGFHGPKWIVLAQCSTANDATWSLWAQVLAASSPGVRGIIAYEFSAPEASVAADLARTFIQNAQTQTILDAWWHTNAASGLNWAAIVHKNALGDKLADWRSFGALGDLSTSATVSNYLGFISDPSHPGAKPAGQPIFIVPEPFALKIFHQDGATWREILPSNLDTPTAYFDTKNLYRVQVNAPPGKKIASVQITWVHIRVSLTRQQFTVAQLFDVTAPAGVTATVTGSGKPNTLVLKPAAPAASVTVDLKAKDLEALEKQGTGMHAHHSYFWPRCQVVLDGNPSLTHEFRTRGLIYLGP
jgi:hypothetical protein